MALFQGVMGVPPTNLKLWRISGVDRVEFAGGAVKNIQKPEKSLTGRAAKQFVFAVKPKVKICFKY